jgi:hypothetical protein
VTVFNYEAVRKLTLSDLWKKYDEYVSSGLKLQETAGTKGDGYILCMAAARFYLDIYFDRIETMIDHNPSE